ncbi:MAG: hypothetical protein ACLRQF_16565 [Thomasclavelia ramosa]
MIWFMKNLKVLKYGTSTCRKLQEKRIFPAIDVQNPVLVEKIYYYKDEYEAMQIIRKSLSNHDRTSN